MQCSDVPGRTSDGVPGDVPGMYCRENEENGKNGGKWRQMGMQPGPGAHAWCGQVPREPFIMGVSSPTEDSLSPTHKQSNNTTPFISHKLGCMLVSA